LLVRKEGSVFQINGLVGTLNISLNADAVKLGELYQGSYLTDHGVNLVLVKSFMKRVDLSIHRTCFPDLLNMQNTVMEHFCQIRGMAGDRDILSDVKMVILGRQTQIAC
jgi:hypothetical protein